MRDPARQPERDSGTRLDQRRPALAPEALVKLALHRGLAYWGWELATVAVAAAYVAVYAWPASVDPTGWVWGGPGDALGNASLFTWINEAIRHGQPLTVDRQIGIPFGENIGGLPHEPIFLGVEILLGTFMGAIGALNLIGFLAVPITSWVMYRLTLHVTASAPASCLAGIACGCSTFLLHNTYGEPTLVQVWIFPLAAWGLLRALSSPTPARILVAAATIAVSAMVNFYFALFAALMCITLVGAWILLTWLQERRPPWRSLAAAAAAGVLGAGIAGLVYAGTISDIRGSAQRIERSSGALQILAPDPLDFILPSGWNPWVGSPGRAHYLDRLARTGLIFDLSEMSIAAPLLILAPIGLIVALIRTGLLAEVVPRRSALGALAAVAVLGLWLTLPPTALPQSLRWLSLQLDIHHFFRQYQHFSRAIVLVELGMAALAAAAVARLARNRPRLAATLVPVLVASVLFESFERIPNSALAVEAPATSAWLAAHPGDYAVADYPLIPSEAGGNEYTYLYYQRFHGHPLLNGELSGTESESMRDELRDPNRPGAPAALAALGVRYVDWHPEVLASFDRLDSGWARPYHGFRPGPPGYRLEAAFADGSAVYSVQAAPVSAFAFYAAGFDRPPRGADDGSAGRDLLPGDSAAQIDVFATAATTATLHFQCSGPAGSLELSRQGANLGSWSTGSQPVSVHTEPLLLSAGVSRIAFKWRRGAGAKSALNCSLVEIA